jgi:hypothetical protein
MTDPYAAPQPGSEPQIPPGYVAPPPPQWGPIGKQRKTGLWILLFIVTFGFAGIVWYYLVHEEMKKHTGEGLGGGIALIIAVVFGAASPFLASDEVGKLYSRRGGQPPVTAISGLYVIPGLILIVPPFIWFSKINRGLNEYWGSLGAPAA